MFCNKCGAKLPDDSQICSACGIPSSPATATPAPFPYIPQVQQAPPTPVAKQPSNAAGVIVCLLGLAAALIFLITGIKLAGLESVSGNSIAEAYYQGIGWALIGASALTVAISIYWAKMLAKITSKPIDTKA